MMSPIENAPQLHHTDRGNTFRKVTAAPEALSSFNTWNNSETLQPKDGILEEETFKICLPYQNKVNTLRNYMKPYIHTTETNSEAVTVMNFLPFVWLKPFICCIRHFC